MSDLLVELAHVGLCLNNKVILKDISLQVTEAKIITLVGPNGAGKTSLIRIILGLQKAYSGTCQIKPKLRIGYLPQKLHIEPTLPLTTARFITSTQGASKQELNAIFAKVALPEKLLGSAVQNLSGGEMQRALLARALLRKPKLLVLDEPAQGVDVNGQKELYQLINEVRNETGCAVLMVSHDLHLVMAATDEVFCLNQHICCHGYPDQVQQHPSYLKLFGVEALAFYSHHHNHQHSLAGDILPRDAK